MAHFYGELFDNAPQGTSPHKLVRTDDPSTSQQAAQKVNSTKLEREVLEAIRTYGTTGCTSDELRERYFPRHPYSSITARYKALYDGGYLESAGTKPGWSGRQQRIMIALT
jgi:hypothetical protein